MIKMEKLKKVQEKILELIEERLNSKDITSKELYDYSYVICNMKSNEVYENIMEKNSFDKFDCGEKSTENKDVN